MLVQSNSEYVNVALVELKSCTIIREETSRLMDSFIVLVALMDS